MSDSLPTDQRLDLWLFYARFFKSRRLATQAIGQGMFRINRSPIAKTHFRIKPGDVLTFRHHRNIHVIEIRTLATRRGPALEAQGLYIDLSPPDLAKPLPETNISSRPTKKQRRDLIRLRGKD
ncbi:MAG: RNA-binding S4 domain-containing protein [Alphaproteobacteria bacterium]